MGFSTQVGRPQEVDSPNPLNGTPRKKYPCPSLCVQQAEGVLEDRHPGHVLGTFGHRATVRQVPMA